MTVAVMDSGRGFNGGRWGASVAPSVASSGWQRGGQATFSVQAPNATGAVAVHDHGKFPAALCVDKGSGARLDGALCAYSDSPAQGSTGVSNDASRA